MYIIKVYKGETLIQSERYSEFYLFIAQAYTYNQLIKNAPERCKFDKVEGFYESTCGTPTIQREFLYTL